MESKKKKTEIQGTKHNKVENEKIDNGLSNYMKLK